MDSSAKTGLTALLMMILGVLALVVIICATIVAVAGK